MKWKESWSTFNGVGTRHRVSTLYTLCLLLFIIDHSSGCCYRLHFIDNEIDLKRLNVLFKDIQLVGDRARIKAQVFLNAGFVLLLLCFIANAV